MKSRVPFTQYAQSTSLFTVREARDLYGKDERSRSILNQLHRMKTQGRVRLVANGVYAGALSAVPLNRSASPMLYGRTPSSLSTPPSNSTASPIKSSTPSTTSLCGHEKTSSSIA